MPLLAGRTVLITVAKVDDKTLRVNVIPTRAKADDNPALTTPLTYTGSPEELDAELGKHLASYVQQLSDFVLQCGLHTSNRPKPLSIEILLQVARWRSRGFPPAARSAVTEVPGPLLSVP
jgi:hypothetical protein